MTDRTTPTPDSAAAEDTNAAAPAGADAGTEESAAAPDTADLPAILSAREAATRLGVSERTVRRAIQRGDLTATKHAGSFHITPAALSAFRHRETGQRTLPHTTTPDSDAAAQDSPLPRRGQVATGQGAAEAVAVLRDLLAEERQKSDRLLEASTIWQTRALQLEAQLKAIEAGPIAQSAGDVDQPSQDAPSAAPVAPWRQWIRRITGGG
jgi:excisionase family DNA binding protein